MIIVRAYSLPGWDLTRLFLRGSLVFEVDRKSYLSPRSRDHLQTSWQTCTENHWSRAQTFLFSIKDPRPILGWNNILLTWKLDQQCAIFISHLNGLLAFAACGEWQMGWITLSFWKNSIDIAKQSNFFLQYIFFLLFAVDMFQIILPENNKTLNGKLEYIT